MKNSIVGVTLMLAACFLGSQSAAARTLTETSEENVYTSEAWAANSPVESPFRNTMESFIHSGDRKHTGADARKGTSIQKGGKSDGSKSKSTSKSASKTSSAACKSDDNLFFQKFFKCKTCWTAVPGFAPGCIKAGNRSASLLLPLENALVIGGVNVSSYLLQFFAVDGLLPEKKIGSQMVNGVKTPALNFKDPKGKLTKGKKVLVEGTIKINLNDKVLICFVFERQVCT